MLNEKKFALATYEIYSRESNFLKSKNFTISIILEDVISHSFSVEHVSRARKDDNFLLLLIACVIFNYDIFKYTPTKNQIKELNASFYFNSMNKKINYPFFSHLVDIYNYLTPQLTSLFSSKMKTFSTHPENFCLSTLINNWNLNSV